MKKKILIPLLTLTFSSAYSQLSCDPGVQVSSQKTCFQATPEALNNEGLCITDLSDYPARMECSKDFISSPNIISGAGSTDHHGSITLPSGSTCNYSVSIITGVGRLTYEFQFYVSNPQELQECYNSLKDKKVNLCVDYLYKGSPSTPPCAVTSIKSELNLIKPR
jgi:hypothetical protein